MARSGGNSTPIDAGLVSLVSQGMVQLIRGVTDSGWFGPGQPLPPQAPPDTKIRGFDYPFAVNLQTQPRQTESGVSYQQLRALADAYDLVRCVIESRKDQAVAQPWTFRLRKGDGESDEQHATRSIQDPRVQMLNQMFRYPDNEHDWKTWLRCLLEEVFVIDALSLAPQYSMGGTVMGVDIIDGATIVRKIDENARTPLPPSPAYQQIIKGLPSIDLTTRDLIFRPRNYRANKIYGYSPVEQIIVTVNMALRRQQSQLSYYTEGNIPEAIVQAPDTWNKDDILSFQSMFDNLAGNQEKKSRMRMLPKLEGIIFSKDKMLVDKFDEWLARIVCYCFSVSPQPFMAMMNRATAQTSADTAKTEGLVPILDYISGTLNIIVERYMGFTDIEHAFIDDASVDKLQQAQVDKIYASYGKESIDEQRKRDGQDPIGISPMVFTATGPVPLTPFLDGGPMAEGLPQHAKSPEELDQEKQNNQDTQLQIAQAKGPTIVAGNIPGQKPPDPKYPKAKVKPVKKSFY